ncbi:hypothetical protein V502_00253 [Pseudogymnoascus sp. VKM F-4520 (FW-2644)]|nr:hypothetical protein V502_00253 [Pseudogymnoascus sp. VKM F-4520 (FW-2644)]
MADPEKWKLAWSAVGGTKGTIDLLSEISVTEAKAFAREIKNCNRGRHKVGAREKAVEELLHALFPSHYPTSKLQSHDKRPIEHHYAQMVAACSPEFVTNLLDAKDRSNPLYLQVPARRLVQTHGDLLQKRVIEGIFGKGCRDNDLRQYVESFVCSQPTAPSLDSKESASMAFADKLLQLRLRDIDNDKRWPSAISESDIFFSLFGRSVKKRLPEAKLHDVIMLGLHLLEAKPNLKHAFQSKKFWSKLITCWKRAPELYEDSLALALRSELDGSQKSIADNFYTTSLSLKAKPELIWPLLRLYCLHVPKNGVDLDTVDDLEPLANQQWPTLLFYDIRREQAVRLLNGLHNANPEYNFLRGPSRTSILFDQDTKAQQNFNVVLLLTMLQRDSQEMQRSSESAVDVLRKKAATTREQSDRAAFARAAHAYAIASGNLDLYGETIIWLQRYVRDPLTVKAVFRRDSVMTGEGIELLSGIPHPLPESMTLLEVASRVEKANQILQIFHETIRIAKREPSFHEPDWVAVTSLFGAVITNRVTRAGELQKRRWGSEEDVYTAIWGSTLAILETVNVDFLNEAYVPIKKLLDTLPPTALAAATKAMLEAGNEKRKKQDRQPGDDILERLSYNILLGLAKSEKPELAQQLILRTVIDRPDASSWHRQLLSISFMKSLTAKDANQMLLAFANAIGEKLEEQPYVKVGESQPVQSAPPVSLVKVTTVKYLAKLLDNAEFISQDTAIEVLVELFKAGTHIDIRLTTFESLRNSLDNLCSGAGENWRSNPFVEKIMEALETVVPVAGSVNERRPPRQVDWKEARQTGTLPEISDTTISIPPLLHSMLSARFPQNLRAEFVERILLPILGHSQNEHREWISLFLAKYKANFTVDDLPPTPISPLVWLVLVEKFTEFIPEAVLEDLNRYTLLTFIAPPAALEDFNKSLRNNTALSNTPEVKHWLSVYEKARYSGTRTLTGLVQLIHHERPVSLIRNGVTFEKVRDMVVGYASLCLADYENHILTWEAFVNFLRHPSKYSTHGNEEQIRSMTEGWQKSGRLVLEKVTALVINMKEEHAQERRRSILPSATKLRLGLLSYPCFPGPAKLDQQCRILAIELRAELDVALTGESNVLRWPRIAEDAFTICNHLNTAEEQLRVALHFGKLRGPSSGAGNQTSSALDFVKVALAMKLIEYGQRDLVASKSAASEYLVRSLRGRVEEWQCALEEGLREKVMDWQGAQNEIWKNLMVRELGIDH